MNRFSKKFGTLRFRKVSDALNDQSILEEELQLKWQRPAEQLGIWSDFPRVAKNIKCFEDDMIINIFRSAYERTRAASVRTVPVVYENDLMDGSITNEQLIDPIEGKSLKESDPLVQVLSDSEDIKKSPSASPPEQHRGSFNEKQEKRKSRKKTDPPLLKISEPSNFQHKATGVLRSKDESAIEHMQEILKTFSKLLREDVDNQLFQEKFIEEMQHHADLSNGMMGFFRDYIAKDSKTLKILKVINQAVLAPPYIALRNKFISIDAPIKDVHLWLIEVAFRTDEVVVVHSKRARSVSEDPLDFIQFNWHLQITLDKEITKLKEAKLSITDLELSDEMDKNKKKKIQSIKDDILDIR